MSESAYQSGKCPHCDNRVEVLEVWEPGGINDYGGWALKCRKCHRPFHFYVGRDIDLSRVLRGAVILDTYNRDTVGDKEAVLKRHGITP